MIPYGKQIISQQDIESVVEVLNSDFITQGPKVKQFEGEMAAYCNAKHSFAVNSATSALHIACLALGVGTDDLVWTTPNSFVASANCALYCGADIDFVDISPDTGNMCVELLAQKLATSQVVPKVVIPVHFAGQSCDMKRIHQLSLEYGFKIIEDASHAVGAQYNDKRVGNCEFSDICVFSFHPVKIVTTAEGGMALTNDDNLAKKLELFRSHGVTREPDLMTVDSVEPWYYQQVELGFNYRMTELQAALGLSQLIQLDHFVKTRNNIADLYKKAFDEADISYLKVDDTCYSAYHLFVIKVPENVRSELFKHLRANEIGVNVHYIPIHTQPYYQELGFKPGQFKRAEAYYSQCISIPLFPALKQKDQEYIIDTIKAYLCS